MGALSQLLGRVLRTITCIVRTSRQRWGGNRTTQLAVDLAEAGGDHGQWQGEAFHDVVVAPDHRA
jgi:hypothetical protein